ncbi:MAG TPA: ribonuclease HII [Candidatus Dormibacteraeota bacterium]|nr:ribonuclease HII [Candidatus Dormibacteraeota bacterium]
MAASPRRTPARRGAKEAGGRRVPRPAGPPGFRAEWALWRAGMLRVAGVDECGMGSLCGPVVAAACIVQPHGRRIPGVRDSKQLTAAQREALAPLIRGHAVAVGVGAASVAEIDRINIYHASHLAMRRALRRLGGYDHVLVDGRAIRDFGDVGPHTTIVKGDATSYAIACASIVAKVTRDRLLTLLAARHPQYGWDHNAGYASREHLDAIELHGFTPYHRRSFSPLRIALADQAELDLDFGPEPDEVLAPVAP